MSQYFYHYSNDYLRDCLITYLKKKRSFLAKPFNSKHFPPNLESQQKTSSEIANGERNNNHWQNIFGIKVFSLKVFNYIKIEMQNLRQELPPAGGYAPIAFRRIPLKAGLDPKFKLLIYAVCTGLGFAWFRNIRWQLAKDRLEDLSANSALAPMILAETDRMLLKQLKRNRDAEERIMKDVEGWEVGKWKGLSVFYSFGPDGYFRPSLLEYFMHAEDEEMYKHKNVFLYN